MRIDLKTSPDGLIRCLALLADEALMLQLTDTLAALQNAMETCRLEASGLGRPMSAPLH